ncbi:MAG TPA: ABC transporter substrate-binding protein [Candidatus Binataceae bacterium]|nr:ABC transporter substrate-binding protein [Candidatus Binataceae bacterium]
MHLYEIKIDRGRALIGAILLTFVTLFSPTVYADPSVTMDTNGGGYRSTAANDPMSQVKNGVSDVIDVFKTPNTPIKVRREKLRELGAKYFDFDSMTRSVMGYHWRELAPPQRVEVVSLFTNFINDAYLSKLQDYSVKKVAEELPTVNIQFTRETFDGPEYAQVYSTVTLKEQKDPIDLNYLMHRTNGQWKVYDVTVDAISVIGNYRNQFNRVMNDGGYDKLVDDLRSKTSGLQQQLDNPNPQSPRSD